MEVIISGGTVQAIEKVNFNTGLTSGTFTLEPGDFYTIYYTAAPAVAYNALN